MASQRVPNVTGASIGRSPETAHAIASASGEINPTPTDRVAHASLLAGIEAARRRLSLALAALQEASDEAARLKVYTDLAEAIALED